MEFSAEKVLKNNFSKEIPLNFPRKVIFREIFFYEKLPPGANPTTF
jgi:hypothetical protein